MSQPFPGEPDTGYHNPYRGHAIRSRPTTGPLYAQAILLSHHVPPCPHRCSSSPARQGNVAAHRLPIQTRDFHFSAGIGHITARHLFFQRPPPIFRYLKSREIHPPPSFHRTTDSIQRTPIDIPSKFTAASSSRAILFFIVSHAHCEASRPSIHRAPRKSLRRCPPVHPAPLRFLEQLRLLVGGFDVNPLEIAGHLPGYVRERPDPGK
jgi:hypothetical protein